MSATSRLLCLGAAALGLGAASAAHAQSTGLSVVVTTPANIGNVTAYN